MPSTKPRVVTYLTESQQSALDSLASKLGEKSTGELMRRLLADACKANGVEWPDEPIAWGGNRHNKTE